MSQEVRFSELVKRSGRPETATLWTDPKQDRPFMKAVKENRVLTVIQKPTGHKKDFAYVGYGKESFALYLVFPKPLPDMPEARVIGLKYDLIEERPAADPVARRPVPKLKAASKPVPVEKQFVVTIRRRAEVAVELSVSAPDRSTAKRNALELVREQAFNVAKTTVHDEVKAVKASED